MSLEPRKHFDVRVVSDLMEIRFTVTQLNDANLEAIGEQLYALVEQDGPSRLRLDFARIESVNGTGLAKMVGLHKRVRAGGGQLTLANLVPLVYEVFDITRLTRFLDVRKQEVA
jgi:anti-sigma B factor antagonist